MTFEQLEGRLQELLDHEGVEDFNADEFMQRRRGTPLPSQLWHIVPTAIVLQEARNVLGAIHITNGYRDEVYNRGVGGKPKSMHLRMNAADASPVHAPATDLWKFMEAHRLAPIMGLGRYRTFVHVDTRGLLGEAAPARWDNR